MAFKISKELPTASLEITLKSSALCRCQRLACNVTPCPLPPPHFTLNLALIVNIPMEFLCEPPAKCLGAWTLSQLIAGPQHKDEKFK